jgi:cell division protein FtsB
LAKAIYGHTGADVRLAAEIVRLRARVRELEAEVAALTRAEDTAPAWAREEWTISEDLLVPDPL